MLIALLSVLLAAPVAASDQHDCQHEMTSIASLHHCIHHAWMMGHITNEGVATSLLAKIDAAHAAFDRGQPAVAINILQAFINAVRAQAGVHIDVDAMHADHLIMHAQMVINTLAG